METTNVILSSDLPQHQRITLIPYNTHDHGCMARDSVNRYSNKIVCTETEVVQKQGCQSSLYLNPGKFYEYEHVPIIESNIQPCNTVEDDQQMMIYSFENNQELIPTNILPTSTIIMTNQNNTEDNNNDISSLDMIFSPLPTTSQLIQTTPQTPTLDNIDWVNLFSQPGYDQQTAIEPSSLSVGSSTSNSKLNDAKIGGNTCNNSVIRESKGSKVTCSSSSSSMKKKGVIPRFAFHTRSAEDVLDDGYKWRKYGQKSVKNSVHPRSYYRCTYHTCNVKKQIQRHSRDTNTVITTYEGIHNHPSEKLMETLSPLLKQLQFLSRF